MLNSNQIYKKTFQALSKILNDKDLSNKSKQLKIEKTFSVLIQDKGNLKISPFWSTIVKSIFWSEINVEDYLTSYKQFFITDSKTLLKKLYLDEPILNSNLVFNLICYFLTYTTNELKGEILESTLRELITKDLTKLFFFHFECLSLIPFCLLYLNPHFVKKISQNQIRKILFDILKEERDFKTIFACLIFNLYLKKKFKSFSSF